MKKIFSLVPVFTLFLFSCIGGPKVTKETSPDDELRVKDPHSYSDPTKAVVTHLDLSLDVDFEKNKLFGTATWDYTAVSDSALFIYFDVKNLNIEAVYNEMNGSLAYELGPEDPVMGRYMKVGIGGHPKKIHIKYSTTDSSDALQWLTPDQTAGKKYPFLYTQSEPILARSWIPCQDSPGIRFTYSAKVKTPPGYLALMSAKQNPVEKAADGVYSFEQPNAIPSYLMALAVGNISFKSTGPRTGVYAEPVTLDKAAWEFEETEKMIKAAEELYGPYVWGRYDILVLPPSFPYGGMENPNLTFATPTVIAGDRSLTSLIAHELAHSWSGNLVTNATWNDFWLNEGFTVYLERRLMETIQDTTYADMLASLGYGDLMVTVNEFYETGDSNYVRLKLDLAGTDPDVGMSDVGYEKGYLFLKKVEQTVGRKRFDAFLKNYFQTFKFKSLTTERFVKELYANLITKDSEEDKKINVEEWVFGTGMPADTKAPVSTRFNQVNKIASTFLAGGMKAKDIHTEAWTSHEFQQFLRSIKGTVSPEQMKDLDAVFNFTKAGNSEVLALWLEAAVIHEYKPAYPALNDFLARVGRRKFLVVLYGALMDNPNTTAMGIDIYKKVRKNYHSVSAHTLDGIIEQGQQKITKTEPSTTTKTTK